MGKFVEICNHCSRSVAWGSGLFVNRVPDFNDVEEREANGSPYPKGDFICIDCDSELRDSDSESGRQ